VVNIDGTAAALTAGGASKKIAIARYWNPASPSDHDTVVNPANGGSTQYFNFGYALADPLYSIFNRMAVLVGVDQGTAAHPSGVVAALSGLAGENYRAPAIGSVVANALSSRFPNRVLPHVRIGGPVTSPLDLPASAAAIDMTNAANIALSYTENNPRAWTGLTGRQMRTVPPKASGIGAPETLALTEVDALLMKHIRRDYGQAGTAYNKMLEQLYEGLKGSSRVLAQNVVNQLNSTPGLQFNVGRYATTGAHASCIDSSSTCFHWWSDPQTTTALKLLKSGLTTSVNMRMVSPESVNGFDTHNHLGFQFSSVGFRVVLEQIGRMLIEMSLTPGAIAGRSLLDETVVYVCSDFGRTFPKSGLDSHHPATVAMLCGGNIIGNQMIGAWDESLPAGSSPMGVPVAIAEEDGHNSMRKPIAGDVAATLYSCFGLRPNLDYFIPGGFGVVKGVST
jgi:Protein of unknown function (DUF1501)